MQKIRQGDTVQVIAGNDLGLRGEVKEIKKGYFVNRKTQQSKREPNKDRLVVAGVRMVKKHQRPISQTRTQTGIIEFEAPIHISNVMLVCPSCDEPVRVGIEIEDGRRSRTCKQCGVAIDK